MTRRLLGLAVALALLAGACGGSGGDADASGDDAPEGETPEAQATDDGSGGSEADGETGAGDGSPDGTPAPPTPTPIPEDAVIIGAALATSGLMQREEQPVLTAAQLQVDAINEAGGILGRPVVLRHVNTRSELNASFNAARRLVEEGADVLLVGCDAEIALPAVEVGREAEVLMISPCGSGPRFASGELGPLAFSLGTVASTEGTLMAEMADEAGARRAVTFADQNSPDTVEHCRSFAARFRRLGGAIVGQEQYFTASPESLEESLAAVVALSPPPDVIALCGRTVEGSGGDVLFLLRGAGVDAMVVTGSSMDGGTWTRDVPRPGEVKTLSYAAVGGDDPDGDVRAVLDAYEDETGVAARSGALVVGADAVQAFARAAEIAGSVDAEAVARALEGFDGEPLVTGPISIDPDSHVVSSRPVRVMEVDGGRLRFVETRVPADG